MTFSVYFLRLCRGAGCFLALSGLAHEAAFRRGPGASPHVVFFPGFPYGTAGSGCVAKGHRWKEASGFGIHTASVQPHLLATQVPRPAQVQGSREAGSTSGWEEWQSHGKGACVKQGTMPSGVLWLLCGPRLLWTENCVCNIEALFHLWTLHCQSKVARGRWGSILSSSDRRDLDQK